MKNEESKLEKLSCETGKWLNEKGEEVKPKPIGKPKCFKFDSSCHTEEDKLSKIYLKGKIIKANAYSEGEAITEHNKKYFYVPVQFYKI